MGAGDHPYSQVFLKGVIWQSVNTVIIKEFPFKYVHFQSMCSDGLAFTRINSLIQDAGKI
jgi:hypothetical protein